MKVLLLQLLLTVVSLNGDSFKEPYFLSDEFINAINQIQKTWLAGRNFQKDTKISLLHRLTGTYPPDEVADLPVIKHYVDNTAIPSEFDWREKGHKCKTLLDIRHQGHCGSCWAVAAASAMSDRICLHSDKKLNFYVSEDDILSCSKCGDCTDGGKPSCAYSYWNSHGVVSGGTYGSDQGCQPYEVPPNDIHPAATPTCKNKCQVKYRIPYAKDIHNASTVYAIDKDVKQIQYEVMTNGPVTATIYAQEDFLHYQGGVYYPVAGNSMGWHSVKILGWGEQNGYPYWIVANTWGGDWGINGFTKFIKGNNSCSIESYVIAGTPA